MRSKQPALPYLFTLGLVAVAPAQSVTWVGKSGAWENRQNWLTDQAPKVNRVPINGDRINLYGAGVTVAITAATGALNLNRSDAFQSANANNKILQTGGTINIDQFLLSSTKAAVAKGHVNYELRAGTLYSDYRSTFTWDNNRDRASRFLQTGGSARFGASSTAHGLQMAHKSSTQQAYYDLSGGTFDCGWLKLGSGGTNQTAVFTQTGRSIATIRGTLHLGARAGTTGQSIYKLHGGTLTMTQATGAFAFTQPGAPVYFDFGGGVLNLRGTWHFATLTAIASADFRVYGTKATAATLFFKPVTINGQAYTRISDCSAFAGNYDIGLAGKNGIPTLKSSAPPKGGTTINVSVSNSSGIPTVGILIMGVDKAWLDVFGGKLLVAPQFLAPLPIPANGGLVFSQPIPRGFCNVTFYVQVMQPDAAAARGVSMTPGLRLTLGN